MTLCGGESLPVSSLTFNPQLAPKPQLRSAPLPRNAERIPLKLVSEDPAVDSGLKAVSLLKRHSLLAYNITPAASSESRGVVDVQVDFTGLAIYARIAPHKTGYAGVPHR